MHENRPRWLSRRRQVHFGRLLSDALICPSSTLIAALNSALATDSNSLYRGRRRGFRPIETDVVVEMCTTERAVIAFGAGSLMRAQPASGNGKFAGGLSAGARRRAVAAHQSDPQRIRPTQLGRRRWKRSFTCSPSASPSTGLRRLSGRRHRAARSNAPARSRSARRAAPTQA